MNNTNTMSNTYNISDNHTMVIQQIDKIEGKVILNGIMLCWIEWSKADEFADAIKETLLKYRI